MEVRTNYFVFTGAMGAGKSAVVDRLSARGTACVAEPARQILKEQRSFTGSGVPETDAGLFNQLMLSRAVNLYQTNAEKQGPVVFDRGIADLVAYAELFGIDTSVYLRAAEVYRYNPTVLYFGGWREIYTLDEERKMSFELANEFGNNAQEVYARLGYKTVEVPKASVEDRVAFVLQVLGRKMSG